MEVVVIDDLAEPLGDRLEVAAREPAIGREALGQDQHVAALSARASSSSASQPPMFASPSFLALIVMPSASDAISRTMSGMDRSAWPGSRVLMNQAFSANRQASRKSGSRVPVAHGSDCPEVLERDRLAAARVVGHGHEHDRDVGTAFGQERVERLDVHVALERVDRGRVAALGDDEVDRLGAGCLDIRPGRVEVGVVRDDLARPADDREQDLLGRPALVRRDDVAERPQLLDCRRGT